MKITLSKTHVGESFRYRDSVYKRISGGFRAQDIKTNKVEIFTGQELVELEEA